MENFNNIILDFKIRKPKNLGDSSSERKFDGFWKE